MAIPRGSKQLGNNARGHIMRKRESAAVMTVIAKPKSRLRYGPNSRGVIKRQIIYDLWRFWDMTDSFLTELESASVDSSGDAKIDGMFGYLVFLGNLWLILCSMHSSSHNYHLGALNCINFRNFKVCQKDDILRSFPDFLWFEQETGSFFMNCK